MSRWSERWEQIADGTYRRFASAPVPAKGEGYEEWTKPELEAELESRGLPKYGNKPELIERLQADDTED